MSNIVQFLGKSIAHVGALMATSRGDLATIEGLANLKNALFHRLVTVPGTLVHRPTYGVGIKNYQNAPNSFSMQQALAAKIKEQFEQDPRVEEVTSVAIQADDDNPQMVVVAVSVKPIGYSEVSMTFKPFSEAA